MGDVSWVVPTVGLRTATWVPGTSAHSWQAIAAGGTSIGQKGMTVAAKTMALTAMDLMQQPDVLARARAELLEQRGGGFRVPGVAGGSGASFGLPGVGMCAPGGAVVHHGLDADFSSAPLKQYMV